MSLDRGPIRTESRTRRAEVGVVCEGLGQDQPVHHLERDVVDDARVTRLPSGEGNPGRIDVLLGRPDQSPLGEEFAPDRIDSGSDRVCGRRRFRTRRKREWL